MMQTTGRLGRIAMALAIALAGALMLLAISGAHSGRAQADPDTALKPDLVSLKPSDLALRIWDHSKRLRLSNAIANIGAGPLEIFPAGGPTGNCEKAYQRVYANAEGAESHPVFNRAIDTASSEIEAGCMRFHPAHNHWHFNDFARYALVREKTGREVARAEKVSFCVVDYANRRPDLPGSPAGSYYPTPPASSKLCTATQTEGLSVGWEDIYQAALPGQALNLTGVPLKGHVFCLVVEADPVNRLLERNDDNNVATRRLRLFHRDGRIARLKGPCRSAS